MKYLTGGDTLVSDEGWARKQREKISVIFGDCTQETTEIINSLSVTYLRGTTPEQVAHFFKAPWMVTKINGLRLQQMNYFCVLRAEAMVASLPRCAGCSPG